MTSAPGQEEYKPYPETILTMLEPKYGKSSDVETRKEMMKPLR